MQSFQLPDPNDVFVLSYTSDVEILYKVLEFTFTMIYRTSAKYQPVLSRRSFTLFLKVRSLNINSSAICLTEFRIYIFRFTVVRPL